ncbi:hypothetical protein FDP08_19585 [Marinobacter panjinensis]|uniref:Transferrin-binding protein-like solute binding protein n=1 Tax=Marinobacter panjinensis TaxID=2576384 RepID=A0A4U6QQY7_9GAMM|nr:hypothetical protein [Marinobacter panjinensis]MCR8916477.1 hypothetical protein [Marinobacter panjinensis]TKV63307.1 hypothetical protein FDP08_19585 [Marinobacter panjinensis]
MSGMVRCNCLPIILSSLLISACGGSENSQPLADGSSPTALAEGGSWSTPLVDGTNGSSESLASANDGGDTGLRPGIYLTDIASDNGSSDEAITWISSSGRFATAINGTNSIFGTLEATSDGSQFSGSAANLFYTNQWNRVDGSLNGIIEDSQSLSYTISGNFNANAVLARLIDLSNQSISLSILSGSYLSFDQTTSFTIGSQGGISGSDATGCVFDGEISIRASNINVFDITFDARNCGATSTSSPSERNGRYNGVGSYDSINFVISFMSANSTVILPFQGD